MLIKSFAKNLPPDPENSGCVLGWAVLRDNPATWHLIDVYASKDIAEAAASHLSSEFVVKYGSHRLGSDEFVSRVAPSA
jgi:hypothetical protein